MTRSEKLARSLRSPVEPGQFASSEVSGQTHPVDSDEEIPLPDTTPLNIGNEHYQALASRRLQWDGLLWQTPVLALTGEAFLFSIALGAGISHFSRIVSSILALLVAGASLHTLASHRLAELTDSEMLRNFEAASQVQQVHGVSWRDARDEVIDRERSSSSFTDRVVARFRRLRSIVVWFWTIAAIGLVALIVLMIAILHPSTLGG